MIRLVIIIPFVLALVVFSVSNPDPVQMWLVTYGWQWSAGVLALATSTAFFLLGAFAVWVVELRQSRRARRAEARVRELETQIDTLRTQMSTMVTPAPVAPAAGPRAGLYS
ncbi:hypothetical protein AA103196_0971 [Ameyamaea chiangmaiensis NBRC 103196]|uniref:DUF1049 domain-containing protein n=1 Tax=Ameyamaea chiangmaiensis TaxID=442969 RepID=A0A850PCU0_9PROT|nr:lipopolysaccharide assembly protein LapA domain-containing protein [Ameyamaea chiangmaiensis]MBS4076271.1 DUF1049 domain-containing protein [Ameyamaea chiangmaiensis]NVN41954.1 DUF1049 domain-containing protein [Ameyamaea chiangmaiensis]GBQ64774.1 hypothetical protein AA103196_0971 [Ameyamaea chiangmaiensis NBRC 103196]